MKDKPIKKLSKRQRRAYHAIYRAFRLMGQGK